MKWHVIVICFLAVCFWFTPEVNSAELRTWTSKSGKFTVKADTIASVVPRVFGAWLNEFVRQVKQ